MRAEQGDPHARLAAWRQQGADRADPLRFAWMDALARRAARHDGAVRQRLDARLRELVDAYADLLASPPGAQPARGAGESPLKQLMAYFASAPRLDAATQTAAAVQANESGGQALAIDTAPMPVLDEFQQLWSRIRIDSLLRQCLDSLSEDAGPLHSSVLTYRAMMLMREVSPEYLQHFIAYTDVLTWMEQVGGGAVAGGDADGAVAVRKPARAGGIRRKKPSANPEA
ncbi:DUF2894 domain-containing protein [Rhodanobacter sp. DHB23]|uniref:DUF2894 domain-containing protein n=1 Tax=Rhodanobacter sp. DHB23 TaxID=2775923 RepID=UPI00178763D2|nr:DUF2894 domain-containing protein [Rhodanobacter sp. DHB23]MBD8874363.1 DUF2894 domain-containing protein [Rhodanobacter sp. DHB23]